jgi:hypothetical protein
VTHISGVMNGEVDVLSWMDANGDYALKPECFARAMAVLQVQPTIDLFASSGNRKLPRLVALAGPQSEGAEREDALMKP